MLHRHAPSSPWAAPPAPRKICAMHASRSTPDCNAGAVTGVIIGHDITGIALQQAQWHLLRTAGDVVEQHNVSIGRATGLHPPPGLAGRIAIQFFRHLYPALHRSGSPSGLGTAGRFRCHTGTARFQIGVAAGHRPLGGQLHGQHAGLEPRPLRPHHQPRPAAARFPAR